MTEIETKDDDAVTARLQRDDGMVTMEGQKSRVAACALPGLRFRIM
jgi:hypothetical protein